MKILAGDIGGTNARLALVELDGSRARFLRAQTYESRRYPGLSAVAREFIAELPERPTRASYAIAGPVENGTAHLPNLGWDVDAGSLARETGIADTRLLNDFGAVGHAIPLMQPGDLAELQQGRRHEHAPIAIIGAGTGLGQGFLVWTGERYRVCGSEGGHADFAARSDVESELHAWLRERYGRVSCERVISGTGLVNIYRFLAHAGFAREQPAVQAAMAQRDPAAVITELGLNGTDLLCVKALDLFASAYGAQAGNLALTVHAGAVYLAGGIAPKILPKLGDGGFIQAFRDKGRFGEMMSRIPVYAILNPQVGLLGAATASLENLD